MNSKTASLRDKKIISEKLRNETKKMEVRLQQLKLTMSKEKEERLLNGNTPMWTSGAPGAVINYKPNLTTIDKNKKMKLKILKEEEDDIVAQESKGPSLRYNAKHIFSGDVLSSRGDNISREGIYSRDDYGGGRRKCGQCEEALAAVNCKECSEIYCARCFAAFHLKGALRKHRSTPISNISNRVSIPSPLFKAPDFNNLSHNNSNDNNKQQNTKHDSEDNSFRKVQHRDFKENQSPNHEGFSLADGAYDEAMSTQYFQEALIAWRSNDEPSNEPLPPPPRSMIEHSTETSSTTTDQKLIADNIQFTSSLSYAEKLLLRKHRSCQLIPVEMKYILNRLSKNNEMDLLENQRLLQSNLIFETSALNEPMGNGTLYDQGHVEIGSLTELWSEAAFLSGREQHIDTNSIPKSQINVTEVVTTSDNSITVSLESRAPVLPANRSTQATKSSINTTPSNGNNDESQTIPITVKTPSDHSNLKLTSRRPHSSMSRNSFNDRPQSARRMSARLDKGGKITTKPSVLLNVLASFNEYLPNDSRDYPRSLTNSTVRFNSAGTSRSTAKLNYNFYKISPQSWKPAQAWTANTNELSQINETKTTVTSEIFDMFNNEYDEELEKLNFFPNSVHCHNHGGKIVSDRLSSASSNRSDNNVPSNIEVDYYDECAEEEHSAHQLQSFERELTLLSQKETHNVAEYDELVADSLDLEHFEDSLDLLQSDNFQFRDSLDFTPKNSNNFGRINDDSEDNLENCSSRFDDYDDVHNLQ